MFLPNSHLDNHIVDHTTDAGHQRQPSKILCYTAIFAPLRTRRLANSAGQV